MSKQPPPAPTASTIGPCPTVIQVVGRPGAGSFPSTLAPPDHPTHLFRTYLLISVAFVVLCRVGCLKVSPRCVEVKLHNHEDIREKPHPQAKRTQDTCTE